MKKPEKKPFFAKFLENQLSEKSNQNSKGGKPDMSIGYTQKYPSDGEDHITNALCDNPELY